MSTRAMIEIQDDGERIYVEKMMDGYPDDVIPELKKAVKNMKRKNLEGYGGSIVAWLITNNKSKYLQGLGFTSPYLPTSHGDFEWQYDYLYVVNTRKGTVTVHEHGGTIDSKKIV